jgi:dihydroneopterin aldolase
MWYVKLVNVKMCAKIGVYAEEQILGNDFLINVAIGFEGEKIMQLQQTIDYCMLYEIVAAQMQKPTPLLEEVISNIVEIFEKELPNKKEIYLSIQKLNPAFGKAIAATEVVFQKHY